MIDINLIKPYISTLYNIRRNTKERFDKTKNIKHRIWLISRILMLYRHQRRRAFRLLYL